MWRGSVAVRMSGSKLWGVVAWRLECQALNLENLGSNHLAAILKLLQFRSSHIATVHS